MSVNAATKRVEQAETEIAVLRVRFDNLDEKMDELKGEVKDLHECLDRNMDETKIILKEFQDNNKKSHDELAEKINGMEKIKWMLMGAAAVLGATGVEAVKMIFGMG
jgi:lipid II:glycine glycyltransferase (peptidoglycan interpeptide bridge formation enzyme)